MTARSAMYFSLRANAHALTAGAGASSVARRLRLAALLHDDVVVDVGAWDGRAGPTGMFEVRFRIPPEGAGPFDFQTPRARGIAGEGNFSIAAKATKAEGPPRTIVRSATTIAWRPTFEPFRRELPRAYDWLHFEAMDLPPEDKAIVSKMVREDERDAALPTVLDNQFSRQLVIASANFALVLGSRIGATVSMDAMHSRALSARVASGRASPVFGAVALSVMFPVVDDLTWDEIDEARRIAGMASLRSVLADVEAAAWSAADAGGTIDGRLAIEFAAALRRESERIAPSFRGAVRTVAIGGLVSLVTGPLPLIVSAAAGVAVAAGSAAMAGYRREHSWIAAADKLAKFRSLPGVVRGDAE